jgi:hypothetical protein
VLIFVRSLAACMALVLGICTSQVPEFVQQYRQRLGGAIDELHRILDNFDSDAAQRGMSRDDGLAHLHNDADPFVRQQGARTSETIARLARLERQLAEFSKDGPVARLQTFFIDFDPAIARRTYAAFEPAVPVTPEGFVVGFIGLVAGYGLIRLLAWPLTRRRHHVGGIAAPHRG